jgi:steroid delta-isomerase-like uncharacterized protein
VTKDATQDLIAAFMAAYGKGDVEALKPLLADDVAHDVNQGGERRIGFDRFEAYLARMAHHYTETITDETILVGDDGTRAAAEYNVGGTYDMTEDGLPPASGQGYQLPHAMFFAIRDGRIARITHYYNLTDWLTQITRGPMN